jgi:hypothetical protein
MLIFIKVVICQYNQIPKINHSIAVQVSALIPIGIAQDVAIPPWAHREN